MVGGKQQAIVILEHRHHADRPGAITSHLAPILRRVQRTEKSLAVAGGEPCQVGSAAGPAPSSIPLRGGLRPALPSDA
jgi:hypothetical protein